MGKYTLAISSSISLFDIFKLFPYVNAIYMDDMRNWHICVESATTAQLLTYSPSDMTLKNIIQIYPNFS